MPLGLLAKDSIQDLESLGKDIHGATEASDATNSRPATGSDTDKPATAATTTAKAKTALASNHKSDSSFVGQNSEDDRRSVASSEGSVSRQEANPQQPPSFQYSGFSDNYYYDDNYANFGTNKRTVNEGGLWWCLFPWLRSQPPRVATEKKSLILPVASEEDADSSRDGESTNSNLLGEKLSDRERQAVLARLRLAQPESSHAEDETTLTETSERATTNTGSQHSKKGLLNGIPVYDKSPLEGTVKGILKNRSSSKIDEHVMENGVFKRGNNFATDNQSVTSSSVSKENTRARRSLFPSYEVRVKPSTTLSVHFAPMARVVTVKSKNDMADGEKGDVWWRRTDYEDFRKTGRIITRAMLEGGSEIWLTSNEAPAATEPKRVSASGDLMRAPGDKWWHTFGHSRRGLEHVVSIDEGRQRQTNVKTAIRSVLEEQSRQKMYQREDPEKLRSVALHHTTWARDLALASAASDADAVVSSFAEDRRSREFYLLKMSRGGPKNASGSSVPNGRHVPLFMQPERHASKGSNRTLLQQRLDAHTAAQIQFRRQKKKSDVTKQESQEPVHDPDPEDKIGLARQAAGFSADGEKVNMAAVLSGMGVVSSQPQNEQPTVMRVAS